MNNSKDGGGIADKLEFLQSFYLADLVAMLLPYNESDRNILKQHIAKTKNREQLLIILKAYKEKPYGLFAFEEIKTGQ